MLTQYRRHLKTCDHRGEGRAWHRCKCPVWVEGTLSQVYYRESLNTGNWEKAGEILREWEARGKVAPAPELGLTTIEQACTEFLRDAAARELREPTLYKYRLLFRRLAEFAGDRGIRYIAELDLGMVRAFRASWLDHNLAALKKLERLRAFFRFCQDSKWTPDNPARLLKNPKITQAPTMPFSRDQVASILRATSDYPDRSNAPRVRALVLLLRYSGLRIRDAVTLGRERIRDGRLFVYTAKTGTAVWCPLPPFVIEALESLAGRGDYFFWSGESKPKSAVGDWQRSLGRLFRLAGVPDGHAHRFRDTFSIELLLAGVPLERVSMLLGHQSVRVTERHYAPWVAARQEQLEVDVRRTWGSDILAAVAPIDRTPIVRSKSDRPN